MWMTRLHRDKAKTSSKIQHFISPFSTWEFFIHFVYLSIMNSFQSQFQPISVKKNIYSANLLQKQNIVSLQNSKISFFSPLTNPFPRVVMKAVPHTNLSSYFCFPNTNQFYASRRGGTSRKLDKFLKHTRKIAGFCCKLFRNWFPKAKPENQGKRERSGHKMRELIILIREKNQSQRTKIDSCCLNPLHLTNLLPKLSISMWPLFLICLKASRWYPSWFGQDLGHPLWVQDLDSLLNAFLLFLQVFQLQAPILPLPKQKMVLHSLLLGRNTHS